MLWILGKIEDGDVDVHFDIFITSGVKGLVVCLCERSEVPAKAAGDAGEEGERLRRK
jgi:hypothetical protein